MSTMDTTIPSITAQAKMSFYRIKLIRTCPSIQGEFWSAILDPSWCVDVRPAQF